MATDVNTDLDYWAWTIIANVSGGDWSKQTDEWRAAATRWRDAFHRSLDGGLPEWARERDVPPSTSTRRRSKNGLVHEMADRGVGTMCGRSLREPWEWVDDPVTCSDCIRAERRVERD